MAPTEVPSIGGCRYMLLFKDDYSHYRKVFFLKHKDEVYDKFAEFLAHCKNQIGKNVKILRTDNGKEFINYRMRDLLIRNGIQHQTTVPYNPEQNGHAARDVYNYGSCKNDVSIKKSRKSLGRSSEYSYIHN